MTSMKSASNRRIGEEDTLDTYHPPQSGRRVLAAASSQQHQHQQQPQHQHQRHEVSQNEPKIPPELPNSNASTTQRSRWLPQPSRLWRSRLAQKIARLSSLDSTRSSSPGEPDSQPATNDEWHERQQRLQRMQSATIDSRDDEEDDSQPQGVQSTSLHPAALPTPRISITSSTNDNPMTLTAPYAYANDRSFAPVYASPVSYGRADARNHGSAPYDDEDDEDIYDLFDERQGLNSSEENQNFTNRERHFMTRPSLDGSLSSELPPLDCSSRELTDAARDKNGSDSNNKQPANNSSSTNNSNSNNKNNANNQSQKSSKARSKSPSSSSVATSAQPSGFKRSGSTRHSRKGLIGVASRLKLTRKHESIAKLQLSILNSKFVSLKSMDRDLQTFLPRERLTPKEFEDRVKLMRKFEVLATIEYKFVSRYEIYVSRHAQQEANQLKNNYKKCIPYDYNRVVLRTLSNVPHSDYINASHVDSCLKPNAYIAAQGPNENTIEDFWRMIWEQKTFVIVMLTKVFDFIRVMCNQYWPVECNKPERYGNIEVTLLYEEPLADFVIRTIKLTKMRSNNGGGGGNGGESANIHEAASMQNDNLRRQSDESFCEHCDGCDSPHEHQDNKHHQHDAASLTPCADCNNHAGNHFVFDELGASSDSYDEDEGDEDDDEDVENEEYGYDFESDSSLGSEMPNDSSATPRARTQNNASHVRLPKFPRQPHDAARASRERRARSAPKVAPRASSMSRLHPASCNAPVNGTLSADARSGSMSSIAVNPTRNEFLSPLYLAATDQAQSRPGTPATPRTPSSAGLDRSSATRRAVKKKRRAARIKNARPIRTEFQVPDESQLFDDDEDIVNLLPPTAATATTVNPLLSNTNSNNNNNNTNNERVIYQFHYNSWASHTCPSISSLLHFRRRVRICMDEMSKSGRTGPTVVHCNDGCGRTGTYLCIDANLELAEEDNVYDVYHYTKRMRQSRRLLIENLEQYKFVYDTIEEAMYCGKTWFPVSELHKRLKHKSQRNPVTKKNEYQREYEKITRMASKFSIGDCAGGHRVENREKNRDVSTVPPDNFRPYLTSFQSNDNTDYINAVFVDGYTRSKEYIVTEWPLHKTISDFWSLIYDHDCNSVILLANPLESSTYPSFLPGEKELRRKFGPVFSAEMVSYTHYQNIKSWIYTINKKIVSLTEVIAGVKSEAKTTQVFQITCWPQGHRVPTSTNALVELMNMVERWRQRTAYGPVCVVSLDGKSRAGVYCAANVAIEQVVQHSEVDVFQAVKTVRRHRPQLIENMTEYKYCYDLILHYVLHYVNQSSPSSK